MIFPEKKQGSKFQFTLNNNVVEHTTNYNYLGLLISSSDSLHLAIKNLTEKASRAYYAIKRQIYQLNPSIKMRTKLYDSVILPNLLYGSKVWGPALFPHSEKWEKSPVEQVHLHFCKNTSHLHRNAPNNGCRAELGRFPLMLAVQKISPQILVSSKAERPRLLPVQK